MNSYVIFLKLLKIIGRLIVVTRRQGNIKERIQAPTNNAKRKLACEERPRLGNEFFKDKSSDENGTKYMRVHYATCRYRFLKGITPHVQLLDSEKLTCEKARDLWKSSVETEWDVSEQPLWKTH